MIYVIGYLSYHVTGYLLLKIMVGDDNMSLKKSEICKFQFMTFFKVVIIIVHDSHCLPKLKPCRHHAMKSSLFSSSVRHNYVRNPGQSNDVQRNILIKKGFKFNSKQASEGARPKFSINEPNRLKLLSY